MSRLRTRLRRSPAAAGLRLARLNLIARFGGAHQDFETFANPSDPAWRAALDAAQGGTRVLVTTNLGGHFGLSQIDRLLAVALTLRGARVSTVLCDAAVPACQMCEVNLVPDTARFVERGPPSLLCGYCSGPARAAVERTGLPVVRLGAALTAEDRETARAFAASVPLDAVGQATFDGLPVGEHALAGALRYFARGELADEPAAAGVVRRFLEASILIARAYDRIFAEARPDVVVAHHGIYVPQGIVGALARARGIRLVTWNPAYRKKCFVFSHDDTYHHTLMDEPVSAWREPPLTDVERETIERYLASRRTGDNDWIRFHRDPVEATNRALVDLGLDPAKPLVLALTNVFWDAQLHYRANAFRDQRSWLVETVRYFAERPDLQLVVRVHPAEETGSPPSRQRAADELARAFPTLPPNVAVVPPESALSTYGLAERADAALIYATKTGVELAATGLPVVVAGEAWSRGKGFTIDARNPAHYREILSGLPFARRLDPARCETALAYARHFFFSRMIPIESVEPAPGARRFTVAVDGLDALRPGRDPGLDLICDGIATGSPFVVPRSPHA